MALKDIGKGVRDRLGSSDPSADAGRPAAAPPKDINQMRRDAEDAKEKWMRENGVDENGDKVKPAPSPSPSAIERRYERSKKG